MMADKAAMVVYYGEVGKGPAQSLRGFGCRVTITKADTANALQAAMEGYKVITVENCVQRGNVTITDCKDILNGEHFMLIKYNTDVCNISNFDCEIQIAPPLGRQPAESGEAVLPSRLTIPPQVHLHMTSMATLI